MVIVTFGERKYEFGLDDALKSLTGTESMLVEEFLGGWGRFRDPGNVTRSLIIIVWLAKRSAGETATFDEIAATPGLVFGDMVEIDDVDEPQDPMTRPSRPLAETSAENASIDGGNGSAAIQVTSDSSGQPPSPASIPA